ncbi:hypothetical protein [Poseidonibacter sp.]|uniref:hypothetical protein n=1 Tax=Poseidonibacter sp. TaxID=2321188 RepID=UPI003C74E957
MPNPTSISSVTTKLSDISFICSKPLLLQPISKVYLSFIKKSPSLGTDTACILLN